MDITIRPGILKGSINAIPSKSQAHRLLICAALSDSITRIHCAATNRDIESTVSCLNALGADIRRDSDGYTVTPIRSVPEHATLRCGESGSTLRFLLPVAGALGVNAVFLMEGRLPSRPLSPLWEEMERMGCRLSRPTADSILCRGKLRSGTYSINGGISSQYITGLLIALSLIPGTSSLEITGRIESMPYIQMTEQAMSIFGIHIEASGIPCSFPFHSPGTVTVEGDWSNAAFFLAANALGSDIRMNGLDPASAQGDRAVTNCLAALENNPCISAADIPDLVPILAVAAGAKQGATFTDIGRLRLKESDRVETVASMLRNLGATVSTDQNTLKVYPARFHGCTVDAAADHRIAMAAAIAATVSDGPVTVLGAECVTKSYPAFWEDYKQLGGQYEQYIR